MEPSDGSFIVQPVLQYGVGSANGGGYSYAVANWYVSSGGTYVSPMIPAVQGDVITTTTQFNGTDFTRVGTFNKWYIWSKNTRTGQTTTAQPEFQNLQYTALAFKGVLEAYNVTACNQYPPDNVMNFFSEATYMPGPNWNNFNNVQGSFITRRSTVTPACAFGLTDSSGGASIFY
jgi:hypothetical protein